MNEFSYELLEEIGSGGTARVYHGWDCELKRPVAIKQIDDRIRQDPRCMEQFWEDAQFLANLEHDNIINVYGVEKKQGWLIMELMQGSVADKVAGGPLPPDLVRSIMRQTLDALDFLHKKNRVHGQVRPTNILINDQGRVKLSDFAGTLVGDEFRLQASAKNTLRRNCSAPTLGPLGQRWTCIASASPHWSCSKVPNLTPCSRGLAKVGQIWSTPGCAGTAPLMSNCHLWPKLYRICRVTWPQ